MPPRRARCAWVGARGGSCRRQAGAGGFCGEHAEAAASSSLDAWIAPPPPPSREEETLRQAVREARHDFQEAQWDRIAGTWANVLGVRIDASAADVKRAYAAAALRCHPDKGGDGEAWKKVEEAFRVGSGRAQNDACATLAAREAELGAFLAGRGSGGPVDERDEGEYERRRQRDEEEHQRRVAEMLEEDAAAEATAQTAEVPDVESSEPVGVSREAYLDFVEHQWFIRDRSTSPRASPRARSTRSTTCRAPTSSPRWPRCSPRPRLSWSRSPALRPAGPERSGTWYVPNVPNVPTKPFCACFMTKEELVHLVPRLRPVLGVPTLSFVVK